MTRFGLQCHSKKKPLLLPNLTEIRYKGLAIYDICDFCEKGREKGRTFIIAVDKITFWVFTLKP